MTKELKYLFYILVILLTLFLTIKYYFSDDNEKNSYRSIKKIDQIITKHSEKLILLKNDTSEILEYVERSTDKDKKNYNFWKLITNND
jgi:hypothetical protein|tara:strand:+ start:2774 stop:3037 length:264 start_codon:yes stop_codon:yes gene_type:complete